MTDLWTAHLDHWIEELSRPGRPITRTDIDELKGLLSVREQDQANARANELETEMAEHLDGCGQLEPSELSDKLETLIKNIGYTQSVHLPLANKAFSKYETHMNRIFADVAEARSFYNALPSEEKRFWTCPSVDDQGNWTGTRPQQVDKWSAVRPDLVSPRARALLEILERKRQQ